MHRVHRGGGAVRRLLEIGGSLGFSARGPGVGGGSRGRSGSGGGTREGSGARETRRGRGRVRGRPRPVSRRVARRRRGRTFEGFDGELTTGRGGLGGLAREVAHPGATAAARPTVHRRATRAAPRVFEYPTTPRRLDPRARWRPTRDASGRRHAVRDTRRCERAVSRDATCVAAEAAARAVASIAQKRPSWSVVVAIADRRPRDRRPF